MEMIDGCAIVKVAIAPDTLVNVKRFLKECGIKDYNKRLDYYFPILIDTILGDGVTMSFDNQDLVETMASSAR